MLLSVVIVNWNSLDFLRVCLRTLQTGLENLSHEIIVVDNASGDGCDVVIPREFPSVQCIAAATNLGFAGANNLGVQRSTGEYLLFLNPDTEPIGDAIVRLLAYLVQHPEAGGVGPTLLNTDGTIQTSCVQAFPTIFNQFVDSDILRRLFPRWSIWGTHALYSTSDAEPVEVLSGASLMVRRDAFLKVGQFTSSYFMYAEDVDLCYKLSRAGYLLVFVRQSVVTHHGGQSSSKQAPDFVSLRQRESLGHFFRETKGTGYAAFYRASVALTALVRAMVFAVAFVATAWFRRDSGDTTGCRKWLVILRWALFGFNRRTAVDNRMSHMPETTG